MNVSELPVSSGVYVIYRDDLRLAYVGQSIAVRSRVRSHLRPSSSTRVRYLLEPPGDGPRFEAYPCEVADLNDREFQAFSDVQANGYTLVNKILMRDPISPADKIARGKVAGRANADRANARGDRIGSLPRTHPELIELMRMYRDDGLSHYAIAKILNADGLVTPFGKSFTGSGIASALQRAA